MRLFRSQLTYVLPLFVVPRAQTVDTMQVVPTGSDTAAYLTFDVCPTMPPQN